MQRPRARPLLRPVRWHEPPLRLHPSRSSKPNQPGLYLPFLPTHADAPLPSPHSLPPRRRASPAPATGCFRSRAPGSAAAPLVHSGVPRRIYARSASRGPFPSAAPPCPTGPRFLARCPCCIVEPSASISFPSK